MKTDIRKSAKTATYLFAFVVPALLFISLSIIKKIYPFGDNSIMHFDMNVQYADYFLWFRNFLLGGGGGDYSFTKSLGGPVFSFFGYYLSSPINFLVVFFSPEKIQMFFYFLTLIKISLCGLTFSIFINNRFKLKPVYVIFLSIAYCFTQYNIGQMSNIIWLDGVYMLPLMLLGVWKFINEDKKALLIITVCCSILFNWYTGYMNCIFIVLYYLYEKFLLNESVSPKEFFSKTSKFLLCELSGVLLSCFFFIPVALGQSSGRSVFGENIFEFNTHGSFLNIFRGFLIGSENPSTNITLFCSIFMIVCAVGFFISKSFSKKEKGVSAVFILVFLFSLFILPLESIWCGFKVVGSFQYRFLYVAILALLILSAKFLSSKENISASFIKAGIITVLSLLVLDLNAPFSPKRLWIQIGIIAIYSVMFYISSAAKKTVYKRLICFSTIVIFITEILFNAKIVINTDSLNKNSFEIYNKNQQALIEQIKNYDKNSFYRIDQTLTREFSYEHNSFISNESMAYGYSSVQHYSSSYDSVTSQFLSKLGYCKSAFPTFYHDPILPSDSLLGVKYLLSERQYSGYEQIPSIAALNEKNVYINNYALPLGFGTSGKILNVKSENNSFEYINSIYSSVLGREVEIFKKVTDFKCIKNDGMYQYKFNKIKGILYGSFNGTQDFKIFLNDELKTTYKNGWENTNVLTFGDISKMNSLSFEFLSGKQPESFEENFYVLNMDSFTQAVNEISQNPIQINHISDGRITANYASKEDGYIMLTVPYDKQWKISVNDKKVDAEIGAEALTVIPTEKGENVIEMTYRARGKAFGLVVSITTLIAIIGIYLLNKKRKEGK